MKLAAIVLSFLCTSPLVGDSLKLGELTGHWADDKWAVALESSRSPIEAANVEAPLAFSIEPAKNGRFRFAITDYHEGTWRIAYEVRQSGKGSTIVVGPLENPDVNAKKENIPFSVERDASGSVLSITAAFWSSDTPAVRFRRVAEPVETWARRTVLAGEYTEGVSSSRWNFGVDGKVSRPDHNVAKYESNLDPSEACCDWLTIAGDRIGFAWQEGVLRLYRIVEDPEGCPISCEKEPFLTLVPERTRAWSSPGTRESLTAANRLVKTEVVADAASKGAWFVARGAGVELRFNNVDRKPNPDGFNDPPFLIRAAGHAKACEAHPGNAMRDGVWISADGKLAAFATWSGSSSGLDVVDTANCRLTASIDASGGLAIAGTIVTTDPSCEPETMTTAYCFPAAVYRLSPDGKLDPIVEAGRERTKVMLGVAITRGEHIEQPYTPKAHIVAKPD